MNETYKIRSIGGALLVTIPQRLVRQYQLAAKDEVVLTALDKRHIIIELPSRPKEKSK